MRRYLTGQISHSRAIFEFGITDKAFLQYIDSLIKAEAELNTTEDLQQMLRSIIIQLKLQVNNLLRMNITGQNYKEINQTIRSLNGLVATAGQLQKQLDASPVVKIETLVVQYNKLEEYILTLLPEDKREEVLFFLEKNK